MELSFVISALRKRFWIIAVFALIGICVGLFMTPLDANYSSQVGLVIRQPVGGSEAPDRYLATELAVLSSSQFATEVADEFPDMSPADVEQAISVDQVAETDSVLVVATHSDSGRTAKLASGYANAYLASVSADGSGSPEAQKLRVELYGDEESETPGLVAQIEEVNAQLATKVSGRTVNLSTADPELDWRRTRLANEIAAKEARLDSLILPASSRIYQEATAPKRAGSSGMLFLIAGLSAGALCGLLVTLTWARFSTKVLDNISVGELLDTPVVAEMPHYRSLAKSVLAAFRALPRSAVPVVDQLCVRSEAKASEPDRLIVAVVGSQRGAGASTLALAMAERFATSGSGVVLIDADVRDPKVTQVFNAEHHGGIPSVIANDGALVDRQGNSVFTRTMDPRVSILGLSNTRGATLRREHVAAVLEAACRKAQVVVVDGGPALDLASTIQLTRLADAVVLAVPTSRQKVDELGDLGRQLSQVRDKLLPVTTIPAKAVTPMRTAQDPKAPGGETSNTGDFEHALNRVGGRRESV